MSITKPAGERTLWQELGTAAKRMAVPALLIGTALILLGLLITRVLDNTDVEHADSWVDRWFARHRTPTGTELTHAGTFLAETLTIVGLTAVTAVIFRVVFHRWRESVLLVLCVTGETLIFLLTTLLIDRKRPPVPHLDAAPPTSSYPSGHTAAATAFYLGTAIVLAWHTRHVWLKWLLLVLGVLVPIVVAICRMYRGMHYPSDTVAGLLLGLSLLAVATRLFPLSERDRVSAPSLASRTR
ncbi:MAG: phosphatase PAP2 family protein [Mycobacteriales bacterium]